MKIDIGISEENRTQVANGLKLVLADTYSLYLKTHGYHWNVTGPMFQTLHSMFMVQYTELWNAIDPIAERIRSLGFYAPATYSELSGLTKITDDKSVPKAIEMIQNLVIGNEVTIRTIRETFPKVEEANDQASLDLLTQRLDIHEKTAWMLRALLE
ncbi:MAG: Dps family protein [Leptospiraceae bacterium]|nr:Dps family protein [Leptospiraceae bacterium]